MLSKIQNSLVILSVAATAACVGNVAFLTAATPLPQAESSIKPREVLDTYCVTCHNARLKTAGLALDTIDPAHVTGDAAVWEKVVARLRAQSMPPAGARRPDNATYVALASALENELDRAALEDPNPGRPAVHRLNRAEYANAVRDLLGVIVDGRELLPADDSGYGFDNIADVLSVSPGLLDRYLLAASKIGRLAVGDPTIRPAVTSYRVSPLTIQDERMSEDLPFGSRGGMAIRHQFPVDGEYIIKILPQNPPAVRQSLVVWLDRAKVKEFSVGRPAPGMRSQGAPFDPAAQKSELEVRLTMKAGIHLIGVAFSAPPVLTEGIFEPPQSIGSYTGESRRTGVDGIEVTGPYQAKTPEDSPSRRKIFACYPANAAEEEPCARTIVTSLARRAFRRPTVAADISPLLEQYANGRRIGGFDTGIEWAIERILVDPDFLFRVERAPANVKAGVPYRLSDVELASRLSFFLWSSIPDDELLALASQGKLKEPAVLEQQVRRLLHDERSSALITNFGGQWLWQRNLARTPDPNVFPDFDDNLREAFGTETSLFLASQINEDQPLLDLLSANYTFVNERLARHYEIPNIYGSQFRRVTLTGDQRAGLLGQGSVLMVTSYANRTSPVVRGKWILENLLGAPPPPPPPNVPALKENGEGGKPTSVRARLEQHRKSPVCSSCHSRMDPLGFALENFDATGKWRTTSEGGEPIDASGVLLDGTKFDGPAQFRQTLIEHSGQFISTVTEKLLTYALGRGIEYYDQPAVRALLHDAAPSNYRWSAIILGIVKSNPFQMSVVQEPSSVLAANATKE